MKALEQYQRGRFIPRCTRDGKYEPVQLDGPDSFCVDSNGVEIAGTRVKRPFKPKCDVPSKRFYLVFCFVCNQNFNQYHFPGNQLRPGVCPYPWKGLNGICDRRGDMCQRDINCEKDLKCCFNGCQMECVSGDPSRKYGIFHLLLYTVTYTNSACQNTSLYASYVQMQNI